jgi:hypothetical protein
MSLTDAETAGWRDGRRTVKQYRPTFSESGEITNRRHLDCLLSNASIGIFARPILVQE